MHLPTIAPFRPDRAGYEALADFLGDLSVPLRCAFEYDDVDELRFLDASVPVSRSVAWLGGAVVGQAHVFPAAWLSDRKRTFCSVRVHPSQRGRGLARVLLDSALAAADAGAHASSSLLTDVHEHSADVIASLERCGFARLMLSRPFILDLRAAQPQPKLPTRVDITYCSLLEELTACPACLPAVYALHCALSRDVPLPEQPAMTFAWFAHYATTLPEGFFLAKDGDAYIGESFLHPDGDGGLSQKLTGVLPAYRGRGIAGDLKQLTLDYALRSEADRITTWVETHNAPMLAVSRKLGFIEQPGFQLMERATPMAKRKTVERTTENRSALGCAASCGGVDQPFCTPL